MEEGEEEEKGTSSTQGFYHILSEARNEEKQLILK